MKESTYSERLAARLKTLREKSGVNGKEFAEAITANGYPVAMRTYYGWESFSRQIPVDAFPAIAKALGLKTTRDLLPKE